MLKINVDKFEVQCFQYLESKSSATCDVEVLLIRDKGKSLKKLDFKLPIQYLI